MFSKCDKRWFSEYVLDAAMSCTSGPSWLFFRQAGLQWCSLTLAGAVLNTFTLESYSNPKPFHFIPFLKAPLLSLGQGRGYKGRGL